MRGRSGARLSGHGMSGGEDAIMDLWDGGTKDIAEIARLTGHAKSHVRSVVGRYNITGRVLNAFDQMSAHGTIALLEAIRRHHPEKITRAER